MNNVIRIVNYKTQFYSVSFHFVAGKVRFFYKIHPPISFLAYGPDINVKNDTIRYDTRRYFTVLAHCKHLAV